MRRSIMTNIGKPIEPARGIALIPLTTVVDGVPQVVWDDNNELVLTEVPHDNDATMLVPLTTTVDGVPQFVWDDNNELVLDEIPRPDR